LQDLKRFIIVLLLSFIVSYSQTVLTLVNCYKLIKKFPDSIILLANIYKKIKVLHRVLNAKRRATFAFKVTRKYFITVTFKLLSGKTQTVLSFPLVSRDVIYKVDST
jgi:hypothetical protein